MKMTGCPRGVAVSMHTPFPASHFSFTRLATVWGNTVVCTVQQTATNLDCKYQTYHDVWETSSPKRTVTPNLIEKVR